MTVAPTTAEADHDALTSALRTNLRRDWSFDVLLGVGSNRFDAGELVIDNVRFALGVNSQGV